MAKKIKFALKMKDGMEVRTLQELKSGFDLNAVMAYFLDGKLETWLSDRYYDDLADSMQELDKNDPELRKKLCGIFGVEYEGDTMSIEEIEERNRRINRLKEITDDESVIENVDSVAFSQEELADLLDEGKDTIYLCGEDFQIPVRVKGMTYIGVGTHLIIDADKKEQFVNNDIKLISLIEDNEPQLEAVLEKDGSDIHAIFLCKGYPDAEDENFLVGVMKEYERYQQEEDCEDDDYEEDDDIIDMDIEYKASLKEIKAPEVLKYGRVAYRDDKIIYIAEDGQGTFLARMDKNGKKQKVLRRWDTGDEEFDDSCFGRNYILTKAYKVDEEDEESYYERISIKGDVENIGQLQSGLYTYMEMPQGFYGIDYYSGGSIHGRVLFNDRTEEQEFSIPVKLGEDALDYDNDVIAEYAEYETGKIYLFMGSKRESYGYFYVFDTKKEQIRLATKILIGYFNKYFCVKGNQIIYYGSDKWAVSKLMTLNMKLGKQKCLWDAIGEYENPGVKQMKIMGDYLYILPKSIEEKVAYRIRLNGTERTEIGENRGGILGRLLENKKSKETVIKKIERVEEIC